MSSKRCSVNGCTNPRHVNSSGKELARCIEHIYWRVSPDSWRVRNRRGLPPMTAPMMAVLQTLARAKEADSPFIALPGVHKNTLRSLLRRDWIFESPGLDGVRYTITGRGEKALKVYAPAVKRRDGICPQCGERPKHVFKTGRVCGYCKECASENEKRERALGLTKGRLDRPCSRCKKRPRHRFPGGAYSTYCEHCNRVLKRRGKKARIKRKLKAYNSGQATPPPCITCKEKPRHFTKVSLYDYCADCLRAYLRRYNDRRRPDSKAAKQRNAQEDGHAHP